MAVSEAAGNGPVRKRVVILGGGFGGVNAVTALGKLPVDVTLVDRRNYHLFQPLLYQVALAVLSPADIAQPIRSLVRDHPNVDVLMDEAIGFDLQQQRVHLKTGVQLELRLPDSCYWLDALLLRQKRLGCACSRPEDRRGCDRDSPTGCCWPLSWRSGR